MNTPEYFSMQGKVFIGKRNPDGSREPARWMYDASTLEMTQTKEKDTINESWSGERGEAASRTTARTFEVSLTLRQLLTDTLALAQDGVRVEAAAGTVTAEALGDVAPGDVIALDYAAISDLELEDGTTPTPVALVEDTDYTYDPDLGVITFLTAKTGVSAAYEYAAHSLVTLGNALSQDYYVLFAGLNTVDGSSARCRGEIHKINFDPSGAFGFIQDAFGELQLSGSAKMDPVRRADPRWGPYARVFLVEPTP